MYDEHALRFQNYQLNRKIRTNKKYFRGVSNSQCEKLRLSTYYKKIFVLFLSVLIVNTLKK